MSCQIVLRLTVLAAALGATPAPAETVRQTDPVVVTASRLPEVRSEALVAIDVIDRDAIDAAATQDVVDLLRRVPGVDIVRGGSLGQQASVFIRGTNSNHALVLINGIRVSSLGTGGYAWEHLPLAQIERIEIVRGPRAALWGADAIGGVIQIFTRRDAAPYANFQLGNHDTFGVDTGTGRRSARGGFTVHAGWLESRGQNATRPGNFSFDPDRDGALMRNVSAQGDLQLGDQQLEAMLLHTDNEIDFDQGTSRTRQDVHSLALSGTLSSEWQHRLNLGSSRDRLDTPDFSTAYRSRRQQADWQHVLTYGPHGQASFGVTWLNERGSQIDTFINEPVYEQSRQTRSAFAGWKQDIGAHAVELAGRHDDNSVYGDKSSFSAGWGWRLSDAARVSANWGQGFRAPTMNELYSPGFGGWYAGNASLSPERSENIELALHLSPSHAYQIELRVFRNHIDQLIDFSGILAQAINIDRARIRGAEIAWHWQGERWNVEANGTWQDPRDSDSGETLLRRPKRKATALIERHFADDVRLGVEGMVATGRTDFGGQQLDGYGVLALRIRLPLSSAWSLDARIENLLNRDYTLVDGYHTPGATGLLTLRWNQP